MTWVWQSPRKPASSNLMFHLVNKQNLGLIFGPVVFISMLLMPLPADMSPDALKVAAVACLMAIWWVSEAAPIAATALLPIVLFPLLGVMSTAATTSAYARGEQRHPTEFTNHASEEMTLSIPGTAENVIAVGAIETGEVVKVGLF